MALDGAVGGVGDGATAREPDDPVGVSHPPSVARRATGTRRRRTPDGVVSVFLRECARAWPPPAQQGSLPGTLRRTPAPRPGTAFSRGSAELLTDRRAQEPP
ncbi:hypothetical protein GCM10025875_24400 [Litorihabitans aurantiacus]|uniref:Uncharacterized protein n=1 Tax=Litorihabitans aurantiacus TaxID=1930061 RepID=A0AA37XG45_9MICO|nr:hypothetical protein GCM10025875_24400 [Litorihabitans aurantiacus]